jgi:hypothetical protein
MRHIGKLETALKPFAQEADTWADKVKDGFHPPQVEPGQRQAYGRAVFNVGHLRRAKRLLDRR